MEYSLTSFNVATLKEELAFLEGSFLEKAFMLKKKYLVLRFNIRKDMLNDEFYHVLPETQAQKQDKNSIDETDGSFETKPNTSISGIEAEKNIRIGNRKAGKYLKLNLFLVPGKSLFLTDKTFDFPMHPPSFVMLLRKYLKNRRLINIQQFEFDRVLILNFASAEEPISLVFELFGKGNAILVKDGVIVQPLHSLSFGYREVRARREYKFPPERFNLHSLDFEEMKNIIATSETDIVRCLAIELNTGGIMAEEILHRLNIHKKTLAREVSKEALEPIFTFIENTLKETKQPGKVRIYQGENRILEIGKTEMESMKEENKIKIKKEISLNRAIEKEFMENSWEKELDREMMETEIGTGTGIENVSQGAGKLQRRIAQQQNSIKLFDRKIEQNTLWGELIYLNYRRLQIIIEGLNRSKEKLGWDGLLEQIKNIEDISSVIPATSEARILLCDKSGAKKSVSINMKKDVNWNATHFYKIAKKMKIKKEGAKKALAISLKLFEKNAKMEQLNEKKMIEEGVKNKKSLPKKQFWFELYRWFITSSGNIVVGGKDAKSNERVVKKYLTPGTRYIHCDTRGAPSVVIRPTENKKSTLDKESIREAGIFAVSHSRGWKNSIVSETAYWVKPEQVSRTPRSGEFLAKGAFIISGKRNYMPRLEMRLAIGMVTIETVEKIMCGPVNALKTHSDQYIVLESGGTEKNTLANRIAKIFNVPMETILSLLPSGKSHIVSFHGINEDGTPGKYKQEK